MHVCGFESLCLDQSFFGAAFVVETPMSGWVCHGKPFWIPVGNYWKKALMEEWVFISDEHTDEQAPIEDPVFQSTDYSDFVPGITRISKQCDPETSKFRRGKRGNRIGIVCRIKIIRESGE